MYVAPRPDAVEDPLYGIRLGLTGALSFAAIPLLDPLMPTIVAALPVGLIAAQRKAFAPARILAGPIAASVMALLMAWFVTWVQPMPVVFAGAMWLVYFAGFGMILRTGAAPGMLVVIMGVLFSVVGMSGAAAVTVLRNEFILAALLTLVIAPLVYTVCPARTGVPHADQPTPGQGNTALGAAIRASVLLALSFWLYAVMPPSDIMMAIMAALVLVFPTRRAVFFEAGQRMRATLYGSALAAIVLALFLLSPNLPVLLGLIFLAGLWVGQRMLFDPRPHMAYQNAYPAAMALIAGALSTQDPADAILSRIVLTLTGAFAAAFAVALLDQVTNWRPENSRLPAGAALDRAGPV
ncbi:MAG: FUSC family protein [Sedimentitalea sp.]|nr:FUSC family protein [Sedimentitalea sp.]